MNQIFLFDLDDPVASGVRACKYTVFEQDRARRYEFETDRNRFLNGRAWIRKLLAQQNDADISQVIVEDFEGKAPLVVINGQQVQFSWSFSRGQQFGVLALSTDLIGIDLEVMHEVHEAVDIAATHFHKAEQRYLAHGADADLSRRFLEIWTAKEALVKASGEGLSADLQDIDVTADPVVMNEQVWDLRRFDHIHDLFICVARASPSVPLTFQDLRV